jgi:hypothetical protein
LFPFPRDTIVLLAENLCLLGKQICASHGTKKIRFFSFSRKAQLCHHKNETCASCGSKKKKRVFLPLAEANLYLFSCASRRGIPVPPHKEQTCASRESKKEKKKTYIFYFLEARLSLLRTKYVTLLKGKKKGEIMRKPKSQKIGKRTI